MNQPTTIQANFIQTAYNVSVSIVGNGIVSKTPDQSVYTTGETVTLTTHADPGWVFSHWEGSLSGVENEIIIPITNEDLVITAVFEHQLNGLTVNTIGDGTVSVDPDKTFYAYGEIVTLRAEPALGWSFIRWDGSVNKISDEITLLMDSAKSITANFTKSFYQISTSVIGSGWIEIEPDKSLYAYGELVNLQAYPQSGWFFSHWEGSEIGSENPFTDPN